MPSPIAHGSIVMLAQPALGSAYCASTRPQRIALSLMALFVCGMPDLDIFIGLARTGDAFADHGYQSHSLLIAPAVGIGFAILAGAVAPAFRENRSRLRAFSVGTALYAVHVIMDYLTYDSRGVGLLWPLVQQRFASPIALFVGVEHGEWWLWKEHLLTGSTELVFAAAIWFIARRISLARRAKGVPTPERRMSRTEPITLIDGHVHLRPCFHPGDVLDAAWINLGRAASRLEAPACSAVLLLAEAVGEDAFDRLAAAADLIGGWRITGTNEPEVLRASRDDGAALALVQGRQWACAERLEVLTLASAAREPQGLADGMPIRDCIRAGLEAGAIVTLPWGFGKWTGARRGIMLDLLDAFGDRIALGDSMARPRGLADPVLERAGPTPVIPGTDPLPIARHRSRVGRFGRWFTSAADTGALVPWLRAAVGSTQSPGGPIGRRDHALAAVADQVRLKLASRGS